VIALTATERTNVLAAVRFLRARCGGWKPLVKAIGFSRVTLSVRPSPAVAFRMARLAGVGVDDVLTGRFPPPGTCPHCGHREDVG
jgi:hypothetical protein